MIKRIKNFLRVKNAQLNQVKEVYNYINSSSKSPKINIGQLQARLNNERNSINDLSEVEFQVFSQWGDDGIIQYLVNKIDIPNKTFIEFGVEDYTESNTRFLLINNNWTGYVLDGSPENAEYIKNDSVSWRYELHSAGAFITRENINELIGKVNFEKEVGLLSIDIDGNDYWVWKEINGINPVIVIAEYNSVFGKNTKWTVPYDASFVRRDKHVSNLYYGASLDAFIALGKEKGYHFIGCNSKGNNAYFIRKDKIGNFKIRTADDGYVLSNFREAHMNGKWINGTDRIKTIEGMEVYDLAQGGIVKIEAAKVRYK
ncbi:MAG TPA: hypothetical protein VM012_15350 [Flavitalea sp.]|nr:hypothetical protein [Flavitalea sp.]